MQSKSRQCCREEILETIKQCRRLTLELISGIDFHTFSSQAHPDFSPVGWHLGHIAYTEAYWILEKCAGLPPQFPQYHVLFAADGLPKSERQNLPSIEAILDYLEKLRKKVLTYLQVAPIEKQERLWRWLIQHESQHNETIALILQLHQRKNLQFALQNQNYPDTTIDLQKMVVIPAGEFELGSDTIEAQDNERQKSSIFLPAYSIDVYPVTCAQYREFIRAGGYQKSEFWSQEGWKWLNENPVSHPLYWVDSPEWDYHPVCGVSWYEAQAYANYKGKRLPTEMEWEKAASWHLKTEKKQLYPWGDVPPNSTLCNHNTLVGQTTPVHAYPGGKSAYGCYDMLGNVWEWTDSWFNGYQGFKPYPYQGYSQAYFDNQHRVLRGGSWATRPWGLRPTFRNWYHPWVRQIFAGFRCVV